MRNPVNDNDPTMHPERLELLERAKNGSNYDRMDVYDEGIEIFGRRVIIGTHYGDRADVGFQLQHGRRVKDKFTIGNRDMGFRYEFDFINNDDLDLDPEYRLETFERSFLGFRLVRNA